MPHADPAARKAYMKAYYDAYYEKNKSRGWNKHLLSETPEQREERLAKMRAYALEKQFDISPAQYADMLRAQDGKCALCKRPPSAKAGRHAKTASLAVDHCHRTGEVRKLLCAKCNMALGWYEKYRESVDEYLASTKATGL